MRSVDYPESLRVELVGKQRHEKETLKHRIDFFSPSAEELQRC